MIERKVTHHSAASATATGAVMNCTGLVGALVQVTGTFVAAVTFQGTVDGSTWVAIQATNINSGAVATTATAAGLYYVPFAGVRRFRANMAWTSGTSITATGIGVSDAASLAVTIAGITPGTGATNLGKAEDAAHASGDVGVMVLAVRSDTPAATGADGDYEPLQTVGGRLHVTQSNVQLDDTDKLAVSSYGKGTNAGDTPLLLHATGHVALGVEDASGNERIMSLLITSGDNMAASGTRANGVTLFLFDGTAYNRQRNNEEVTVLASVARTVATDSADQVNYNGKGLIIIVNVTVDDASADLTPSLQIKDSISSAYYTVWTAAAAISAVGTFAYLFDSSALADAAELYTEGVNLRIARTWRLHIAVADADSCTYSASAVILV